MMKNRNLLFILVLVAVVLTGCSLPGFPGSKPPGDDLEVSAGSIEGMLWDDVCVNGAEGEAPAGCVGSQPGSYRANGIFDPGEQGIPGVVIQLGEGVCPSSGAATALTDLYGFYRFEGLNPGVYCVSVDRSSAVPALTSPGVWTWPAGDAGSEGSQTVVVMNAEQLRDINFGWDDFLLPQEADAEPTSQPEEVTPEPTIVVQPTAVPACIDRAAFVSDLTVQDGTIFSPASAFTKKWRIKNTGTCTWDSTYDLVFVSGTAMGSPTAVSFNGSVKPGETVDFAVALKAPSQEGTYTGYWKLRNGDNAVFGFGGDGTGAIWTKIRVQDKAPTNTWRGSYFDNRDLSGAPALVRNDDQIKFDWGSASPASGLPSNRFSVRWERRMELSESEYRIRVVADDGVRLYVDDVLVIDEWQKGAAREFSVALWLDDGEHEFRLEYFEFDGVARVEFKMDKRGSIQVEDWKGTYWPNRTLSGDLAVIRDDADIDFDWDDDGPLVGFPADNFSARWERTLEFPEGVYTFFVRSDDGVRIWIDGKLLIDEWFPNDGSKVFQAQKNLSGEHTIRVEYFEKTGDALIRVWWEKQPVVNTAPQASPDSFIMLEDQVLVAAAPGVLANDSDPEGDALAAELVTDVEHGSLVLLENGSFTYTPAADYHGSDSFTYRVSDGALLSEAVTVTIEVQPVNDTPQAAGVSVQVWAGQMVEIDVLVNDTGLGDAPITLSATESARGVQPVVQGSLVQYTAPEGASGSDSFTYEIRDADGETSSAVVTIIILDPGE